jgi:mutator protein MutT
MTTRRLPLVCAAIAVIEQNGRLLISRRRSADHLGGCWEFPGGKRLVGESWTACLRRELREELGISVSVAGQFASVRFRYPDRRVYLAIFRCAIKRGDPKPLGCEEIRWVRAADLSRYRFPPANRPLLRHLSTDVSRSV